MLKDKKPPLVSIIIPCYNCEKTLERCYNSLSRQSYKELEIVFINDGSRDKTKELLESLAAKDARVRLINQLNQGVSLSRNKGIEASRGEYILFVDSDDEVSDDYVDELIAPLEKGDADIVLSHLYRSYSPGRINERKRMAATENGDVIENYPKIKEYLRAPFLKAFRSSIIKSNNINFPSKISYGEDYIFNLNYLDHIKKYCISESAYYLYHEEDSHLSLAVGESATKASVEILKATADFVKKHSISSAIVNEEVYTQCLHYAGGLSFLRAKEKLILFSHYYDSSRDVAPLSLKMKVFDLLLRNKNYFVLYLVLRLAVMKSFLMRFL